MINWKTTLGGAVFALGTFLMGAATVANMTSFEMPTNFVRDCVIAGFFMQGIGGFFTALFARDRKVSDEQAGAGRQPPVEPPKTP